jgi:DNA-directed RNA polymerase subunit RPC12/RpoP
MNYLLDPTVIRDEVFKIDKSLGLLSLVFLCIEYNKKSYNRFSNTLNIAQIQCPECTKIIFLDAFTYWNIEDTGIKCTKCKAKLTITLKMKKSKESWARSGPS